MDWRTLLLGVAAFSVTFAGGMLLSGGRLPSLSLTDIGLPSFLAGPSAHTAAGQTPSLTVPIN
jgi:hypothetical protein